jgi:transketolase
MEPLDQKWRAFGWNVLEIDGHSMCEVVSALDSASRHRGNPTVIIANTVKGKGVSFMEDNNDWHQKAPNHEQYEQALAEIGGAKG